MRVVLKAVDDFLAMDVNVGDFCSWSCSIFSVLFVITLLFFIFKTPPPSNRGGGPWCFIWR